MTRNKAFHGDYEPLRSEEALEIKHNLTAGPFSFLNPTSAHFSHKDLSEKHSQGSASDSATEGPSADSDPQQLASDVEFKWRSRDNRKGRHALLVDPEIKPSETRYEAPQSTSTTREIRKGILRMFTQYPYWDVSYLVAILFTVGSVIWCINGFFSYLPLAQPSSEFDTEILYGGGITAFLGATVFEIGSILLMFEAVNENRAGCFGWALEKTIENGLISVKPDKGGCIHHHTNKKNFVGKGTLQATPSAAPVSSKGPANNEGQPQVTTDGKKSWQWFPSTHDLKTHYLREIGFLACLAQLIGASVFWISGFTALPGVNNVIGSQGLLDGIYWVPQIVGGSGFIVSGILFMLETQRKWYIPAFGVLGWHIGFWNLVGALGFTLCGALGPAYGNGGAVYETSLATFWGSWAFLIGSVIQWYECLDTHPVEKKIKDKK